MKRFADRLVVVTGAAKGIGEAAARSFAQEGARLVLADFDSAALAITAAEIRSGGNEAAELVADTASETGLRALLELVQAQGGPIDAVFLNAGIRGKIAPVTSHEELAFDEIVRINLRGIFLGLRTFLPALCAQGHGAVVVTASNSALTGLSAMPGYVATKHGVLGLVRSAALEVRDHGVRVNALLPGATKTPMLNELYSLASPDDPGAAARRYAATVPTGRLIEPEEMAAMTLHLCSDSAHSITGGYFLVDGGRAMSAMTTTAGMKE